MVQVENTTRFRCGLCKFGYKTYEEAMRCEEKGIRGKTAKIGDMVRVTSGEGKGQVVKVKGIYVIDPEWGHYAAVRYDHTMMLEVDMNDWGSRVLTFDSWEGVK